MNHPLRFMFCLACVTFASAIFFLSSSQADDSLPDASAMTNLARNQPLAFLESCLKHYDKEVRSYQGMFQKQERLQGRLQPKEVIEVAFRETPYSVSMHWLEGARKADRVIFVAGENDGMMLAHPSGVAGKLVKVVKRKVDSEEARESGRYTLDQFGFKNSLRRAVTSMQAAQKKGTLHVSFLGEAKVIEAGQRIGYKIKRTYAEPESDGTEELTLYVDRENWLPIGIVVKGKVDQATGNRELLGEYFYRDVRLNPQLSPDQFKESAFN
jgi:Protein of unknown function (DUF1571)